MNKAIIIDTNIIIDHDKGKSTLLKKYLRLQKEKKIETVVSTITIFEYYSSKQLDNKQYLTDTEILFSFFRTQEVNKSIAKIAGKLNRRLNLYQKISTANILIASTTLYLDGLLLTRNKKHFKLIPDLRFAK